MPKRQEEEEAEWTSRKEDILALYVEQDKSLSDVMHVMASQGFTRTKPQYERSFKKWRVSKNVRKEEWDFILGRLDERKRPTNVKVRGVVIPQARIERQRLRKRETAFDLAKSRLQPQSRSRTPSSIEISTPRSTAEHDLEELSEEPEHGEHLEEGIPTAGSPQESHEQAQEDDHVLSPTVTAVMSNFIATETPLEATHKPFPSSNSISGTTPRSRSELLYDYMNAAVCVIENELPDGFSLPERYGMRHLDQQPTRELLSRGYESLLHMFVRYTTPKDDLYNVLRAFDTADDMVFLRRLLLIAKSAADWKWTNFFENLLLYAAEDGNERLVVMLLDLGVDIHYYPLYRRCVSERYTAFNALQFAVHGGYQNLIDILTSHGATIFSGAPESDSKFLFDAITRNTIDFAKPLLAKAATANIKIYHRGIELFILAMAKSYNKIIDLLFDVGFSPYSSSGQMHTQWGEYPASAFLSAVKDDKTRYLERFLKVPHHGLDKEQRQERLRQLTAGYVFAHRSDNVALKNAILPHVGWHPEGIISAMGYDDLQQYLYDALEEAVRRPDCVMVKCLIEIGASPNHPRDIKRGTIEFSDVAGRQFQGPWSVNTPLESAVLRGNVDIVRQLIAAGADVNFVSPGTHKTPLQVAASRSNLKVVSLLVEAGANINIPLRRWDRSAMEIAAGSGNFPIVSYLLDSGADVQGKHNKAYRKAVYNAKLHQFSSIVELLQDWKRCKYGDQDCDTVGNIMGTTTLDKFHMPSEEARIDYLERGQSDVDSTMDYTDEE